jgi:hypothetical protein
MNFDEKVRGFKAGWNAALDRDRRSPQSDRTSDFDVPLADALEKFVKSESKNPKGWDLEKALAAVFGYEWPIAVGWITLVIVFPWACFFVQFRAWFVLFALIMGAILGCNAWRLVAGTECCSNVGRMRSCYRGADLNFLKITSESSAIYLFNFPRCSAMSAWLC